jgi:formylglycine-generating enzyme required for sulfatase activity
MAAGGYEDERWWQTESGRAWRRGDLANEAAKSVSRTWRRRFLDDPGILESMAEDGRFPDEEAVERWRSWMSMAETEFELALDHHWRGRRESEPLLWRDSRFNQPSQPVVGVSWYEASAYCAWLGAQSGLGVRLPTEVEWEAAARGAEGRAFAFGDTFDRMLTNTLETHIKSTTPVGVFPGGRTPEGADDLTGNVFEWTSSLFGAGSVTEFEAEYRYPYDAADGREDLSAGPTVRRVLRGGAWDSDYSSARSVFRDELSPGLRGSDDGFRVVVEAT